ncbi:MAG TPA: hypothetical protein VGI03_13195 [Verrucomicrobiae bacterium]|jgi:hypothetical protein
MKFSASIKTSSRNNDFAFTAIEMVISTTIIMMSIVALVSAEIYGSRVYILAATKLAATDGGRDTMGKLRTQIQSAQGSIRVGNYLWANGSATNFQSIAVGQNQVGNAIRIQPGNNTTFSGLNPYTLIFLQPGNGGTNFATLDSNGHLINTNSLIMETFDTNYNPILTNTLAMYVTNQQVFAAVDFTGNNIMTTYNGDSVFQVTLYFSQWEYPIAVIGTNDVNAYNYYRLQTRVYSRNIND